MRAPEERPAGESTLLFREKVDLILALIRTEKIKLSWEESVKIAEDYYHDGIRPISHSAVFRETYEPHYRVNHRRFFTK
jgi:hypothetical protein